LTFRFSKVEEVVNLDKELFQWSGRNESQTEVRMEEEDLETLSLYHSFEEFNCKQKQKIQHQ